MNDLKAVFRSVFHFLQSLFCRFEAMFRGFTDPFHGFRMVLFDASAFDITTGKTALRLGIALLRGFLKLFHIPGGI